MSHNGKWLEKLDGVHGLVPLLVVVFLKVVVATSNGRVVMRYNTTGLLPRRDELQDRQLRQPNAMGS